MNRHIRCVAAGLLLSSAILCRPQRTEERPANAEHRMAMDGAKSAAVVDDEIRLHLLKRVKSSPRFPGSSAWAAEEPRLRRMILQRYVLSGWPQQMIDWPVQADLSRTIQDAGEFTVKRIRLEVLPHFYVTGLLYEPANRTHPSPAVLNVIGHQGAAGIALEEQQRLCIDEARMGMYALSLEWVGVGELAQPGNAHANLASLDLTGVRGVGLMYLADSKALDYLLSLPGVDRSRVGMTGLSGGGFQTILVGSLDERISVAIPVAGFSAGISKVELPAGHGDIEHLTSDFLSDIDYPMLVALRAPRPTLLIYNRNDNCCNRAALMKPWVYDAIRPFFGVHPDSRFAWHTNLIPGTHNYETDNRAVALAFFATHFHVQPPRAETTVEADLLNPQQIAVGLPADALTIATLATQFAEQNHASSSGSVYERRKLLRHIVRYPDTVLTLAWPLSVFTSDSIQTAEFRFEFSDGLTAFGVLRRRVDAPRDATSEILFSDEDTLNVDSASSVPAGNVAATLTIALPLTSSGAKKQLTDYTELLTAFGERPLGMEAAQLNGIAQWMRGQFGAGTVSVQTTGMRSQLISLVASAIQPGRFASVQHARELPSLMEVFTRPIAFKDAPELFCLDLQKYFDIGQLDVLGRRETPSRKPLIAH